MTTNTLALVAQFHQAFGHPVKSEPDISDSTLNDLRIELLYEELREFSDALANGDKVAALDALTDLQYVLDGAYLALGFAPWKDAAMQEVHASNMSKIGIDGKPLLRADGKILKGPGYFQPNLRAVLALPPETIKNQHDVSSGRCFECGSVLEETDKGVWFCKWCDSQDPAQQKLSLD